MIATQIFSRHLQSHGIHIHCPNFSCSQLDQGDGQNPRSCTYVQSAKFSSTEQSRDLLNELHTTPRGRMRARAEGHTRLDRNHLPVTQGWRSRPRRRYPEGFADLLWPEEPVPGAVPVSVL